MCTHVYTRTNRQTNKHTSFTQVRLSGVASFRCKQRLPPDTPMPSPDRRRKKFRKLHIHKSMHITEDAGTCHQVQNKGSPPLPPPESMLGKVARCMRTCEIYSGETPPVEGTTKASNATLILGGAGGAAHTIWIRKLHEIYLTCEISSVNSHP